MKINLPVSALIKVPVQERSVMTVVSILDAAVEVLNTGDPARFTTNRVAEVAGVSIGTLYQYFTNKEALLAGVLERGVLDTEDAMRALVAPPDLTPEQTVAAMLSVIIQGLEPFGPLLKVILSTSPLLSRNGVLTLLEPRLVGAVHIFLLTRDDARLSGGAAALYVGVGSAIVTVLRWLAERPPWLPREALIDCLARQAVSHLE